MRPCFEASSLIGSHKKEGALLSKLINQLRSRDDGGCCWLLEEIPKRPLGQLGFCPARGYALYGLRGAATSGARRYDGTTA